MSQGAMKREAAFASVAPVTPAAMDTRAAAAFLGMSVRSFLRRKSQHGIPAPFRVGGKDFWLRSHLELWLQWSAAAGRALGRSEFNRRLHGEKK